MLGPVIEGERVRLVPPTVEMLDAFIAWLSDTEVTRYFGLVHPPAPQQERDWFDAMTRSERDVLWAVMAGDKHIGSTGIHQINWQHRRAITGNFIGDRSEWGKGYGSEAVRLRTRYAFVRLGLDKLETEVFADNVGSRRCLEKAGYRQYGTRRRHVFRDGRWHDFWLADLLREEWAAENPGTS